MRAMSVILKVLAFILLGALLAGLGFAAGMGTGIYLSLKPSGTGPPVRLEIPKGATAGEVAAALEREGVIENRLLFRLTMKLAGAEASLKPGCYLVDPRENMMEIVNQFRKGSFRLRLVTIPEGLTLKEVAQILEKNGVAKASEVLRTAKESEFSLGGKKLPDIEGYLLPNTYDIPDFFTTKEVLETMLKAFETSVLPLYERNRGKLPYKLTLRQVVILASMVEREAQVPSERPVIAMVYYNRLRRGMRMECDATIQFALGKPRAILKLSDLKLQSPYNTYLHDGLPPGPIANPGIDCIRAAIEPARNDYLYYVRNDVKNDGSHVFSRTFAEHNEAISKYQR
ncbi:MAG: endolytic transglycosylase MltG [Candidatus Eremiobacteraeota bacterium]|nr:endolytic transglycosylase MltG [Candidatus Eremiobacteraeota bacterium]